jgi:hypothetical protein
MSTEEGSKKVAEFIKNADLYDLISISLRSSDAKLHAVDRYIKRAIDRHNKVDSSTEHSMEIEVGDTETETVKSLDIMSPPMNEKDY